MCTVNTRHSGLIGWTYYGERKKTSEHDVGRSELDNLVSSPCGMYSIV